MSQHAKRLGADGETLVATYLKNRGARIIDRNWRIKEGEIDLIAEFEGVLIFVEVKSRTSLNFGHPLEAINESKALRLQRLALAWLATNHRLGAEYRIDVASVMFENALSPTIEYREGVL
jgi:putative endonuclease